MATIIRNGKMSREIHEYLKLLADWNGLDSEFRTEIQAKWNDIFINRKEPKMKLDTDAIKRRFEEAVVVGCDGEMHVFLPTDNSNTYFSLTTGTSGYQPFLFPGNYDWTIRRGDRCESKCGHYKYTFHGFSGDPNFPFTISENGHSLDDVSSIRPIPQLTERQKRIQNIKNELAELERLEKE